MHIRVICGCPRISWSRIRKHWPFGIWCHDLADNARCFGLLLDGRAPTSGIRRRAAESTLLLITNAHHDVVVFTSALSCHCSGASSLPPGVSQVESFIPSSSFQVAVRKRVRRRTGYRRRNQLSRWVRSIRASACASCCQLTHDISLSWQ
jgi:hypothetical protein